MPRYLVAVALLLVVTAVGCGPKARVGGPSSSRTTGNAVGTDQEFELAPGQSAVVAADLKVTFDAMGADSRCAPEVRCVWEGDAVARVKAATGTQAAVVYDLHTNTGFATQVDHGPYRIRLTAVAPGPHAGVRIDPAAYVVTLLVTKP